MAVPVIMPRQGQSVESCIIAKWHKKKGDKIKKGDVLFTFETDKATFDEEAEQEGTLLEIFFEEGEDVPVLTNVCVIGEEGEDASQFTPSDDKPEKQSEKEPDNQKSEPEITQEPKERVSAEGAGISPRARNLAEKTGVDYSGIQGSGPQGRVIENDIRKMQGEGRMSTRAVSATGLGGRVTTEDLQSIRESGYEDFKLTNIRKVIAKQMHHSLSTTAQLTLNSSYDATSVLEFRKKVKASMEGNDLANITINDIVLFAVSRVLEDYLEFNAHFLDDTLRIYENVNMGVAVDTERGLMVPTIFNANKKSLNYISREVKELSMKCRKGTINPDTLKNGTFTVTNLGVFGIESFTPVINPPQTGILGINTIVQRIREAEDGFEVYPAMGLSLTFDHRAVDGAPAAKFLQALVKRLENFELLMAR